MVSGAVLEYAYHALSLERSIRVILLHPARDFNEGLRCDLEQLEVEQSTEPGREYHAISYCWGEPNFSHELLCEDRRLRITATVDSLLRYFRKTDAVSRLWIDGICINQQDVVEKTRQVAMMDQIFFCAMRVHVWLGERLDTDARAFTLLRKLALLGQRRNLDDRRGSRHDLELEVEPLLSRPWFSRRWVLQEIALGHEVELHCGPLLIGLSSLVEGLQVLRNMIKGVDEYSRLNERLEVALRTLQCNRKSRGEMLDLLMYHRDTACSDDRDHIFALLSLTDSPWAEKDSTVVETFSDSGLEMHEMPTLGFDRPQFFPSYALSVPDIYREFARYCLARGHHMRVMCLAACFPLKGTPSWVPDWRLSGDCKALQQTEKKIFDPESSLWAWRPLPSDDLYFINHRAQVNALAERVQNQSHRKCSALSSAFVLNNGDPSESYVRCATRDLHWVGVTLPKACALKSIAVVLRQWLSIFVIQNPLGSEAQFRMQWFSRQGDAVATKLNWKTSMKNVLDHIRVSNKREDHQRAIQNATFDPPIINYRAEYASDEAPVPADLAIEGTSDSYSEMIASFPQIFLQTSDKIYVVAEALGIPEKGYLPLSVLPKFFRTILCDWSERENARTENTASWFSIRDRRRAGFMELITSSKYGNMSGLDSWWKQLATWQYTPPRLGRDEADNVEAFCADLLNTAGARPFALMKQSYGFKDIRSGRTLDFAVVELGCMPNDERDMILGAPRTSIHDVFLTWKPGKDVDSDGLHVGTRDYHRHMARWRISLLLTPSNPDSTLLRDLPQKLPNGKERIIRKRGYRIRGDAWMLPSCCPEFGDDGPIVIDA